MPAGIFATYDRGFVTLTFADGHTKAVSLGKLIAIGGPELISKSTRGTRPSYTVPENIAREAGLLDDQEDEGNGIVYLPDELPADERTDTEREADEQTLLAKLAAQAVESPAAEPEPVAAPEAPTAIKRPAAKKTAAKKAAPKAATPAQGEWV
jgi:hypothetical protein